jgi:VWFA-related protein
VKFFVDRLRGKLLSKIIGLLGILLFLFMVLTNAPSYNAAQEAPRQVPLQYEVFVGLKLVQVHVTDKSGKPARGLVKEDFRILDNGKPVTITEFEEHDYEFAPPELKSPSREERPDSLLTKPPEIGRKFILFFDFAFNTTKGVAAAIKAALHFLDNKIRPDDEVAVLSYSILKGLKVREFLTSDQAKARKAVSALTAKDIAGRADEVEQAYWQMIEITQSNPDGNASSELSRMEAQRLDSSRQAQKYLLELSSLAQALRLVPGQKTILFFSTGIPYSLVNAGRLAGTERSPGPSAGGGFRIKTSPGGQVEIGNSVLRPLQEAMLKEFSASSCSVYAFDTRESSKLPSLFAYDEMAFVTRLGGIFSPDGVHQATSNPFRDDKTTGMDSLRRFSKQTDGQYFSNISFYEKNLDQISEMTGTYYVLGYSIPAVADGKFHNIKVEVKRKNYQVRAQRGYFNPKPFSEYTDLEKKIHFFDLALNEGSELQTPKTFPISALTYDLGDGARLRSLARIPREVLEGFEGKSAEFVALFFDQQGNLLSLQRTVVELVEYRGKEILFTAGTPFHPGRAKCRILIRDLDTGQSAVASTAINIGKPAYGGIVLYSPLLLVQRGGLFNLEGVVRGKYESSSWREIYQYDASTFSPVIGEEALSAGKIVVIVPFSASDLAKPDIVFKANLIDSVTGKNLPVPLELREGTRRGAVEIRNLELSLDNVPPGKYFLYINAGEKASGALASVYVGLNIER